MLRKLSNKHRHAIWQKSRITLLFVLLVGIIVLVSLQPVSAVTSSTLNFQGRLLSNTGALVPDGSYNIQFNLYTVAGGGSTAWTETHTGLGGNAVTVTNGYFNVYLGDAVSGNPFPGTINWDQEHWLGMTVRGTSASCAFAACTPADLEMTPRFKLTAVPYAFRAGALVDAAGNAKVAADFAQLSPAAVQAISAANAAIRLNQTGAGGLLQLQGDGSDVFTVNKLGNTTSFGTMDVRGASVNVGTTSQVGSLILSDGTSSTVTLTAGGVTTNYSLTLPAAAGGVGQCLKTDATTASLLIFQDCAVGAGITSLNGLNGAIQTFAVGTSGTDFNIGSLGTVHTFNIPDASATNRGLITNSAQSLSGLKTFSTGLTITTGQNLTVNGEAFTDLTGSGLTLSGSSLTVDATSSTAFIRNGGNTLGGLMTIGTTDSNGISFVTAGSNKLSILSGGNVGINNAAPNNKFNVNTPVTVVSNTEAVISSTAATNKGLVIQGAASQSALLFELQSSAGASLSGFNSSGNLVLGLTTLSSAATVSRAISLPDAAGTICLSSTDACGFLRFASGTFQVDATTNNTIAINKTGASGNLIALQKNGGAVFTVGNTGSLQIQSTDSVALDIRNVGGTSYFSIDSSTGAVRIGATTADAVGVLLVLDTKNTAGDPTGIDGAQYYNSSTNKMRCFENNLWQDCNSAGYSEYSFANGLLTWTNMPIADTEFIATQYRVLADLGTAREFRFNISRIAGTVTAGADCRVEYSTTYAGTYANLDGGTGPEVDVSGTAEMKTSGWSAVTASARAEVYLRVMCKDGNGANDPQFRNLAIQIR